MRRLALLALLIAVPARAQMTPLFDDRHLEANVTYQGTTKHDVVADPGFFAAWIGKFAQVQVTGAEVGSSDAEAFQNSIFFPNAIQFDGSSGGGWSIVSGGHYDAVSRLLWKVHANQCLEYSLYSDVQPGEVAGTAWTEIRGPGGRLFYNEGGTITTSGRIVSGDYSFEGRSAVASTAEYRNGGTYSLQWTVNPCSSTPITIEPADATVSCNQNASFCVTPNGPVGSFTYQWRRNYVPLSNTAHFTGANSNCLTIHNACFVDAVDYDCLVTANGVSTPTRLAHLTITPGPVGVDTPALQWALGAPVPNPSFANASLHYEAPRPFFARVTIHDAAGRTVRRFTPRLLEAAGTLTWDGRSDSGTPAVPGIYFVRMQWDGGELMQRLVRVR